MCRAEGFFPHPSSCKKYYWCLDTPSQGMVAHTFSCPQGLFFNQITDGCDFLRNVNCGDKDTEEKEETKETSEKIETEEEVLSEADNEEEDAVSTPSIDLHATKIMHEPPVLKQESLLTVSIKRRCTPGDQLIIVSGRNATLQVIPLAMLPSCFR